MQEILITIGVLFIGFVIWRMWFVSKGMLRPMNEIKVAIYQLLEMGYENGILIITPRGTKKFIQLGKYIKNRNEYGVELSFPNANWSRECFEKLRNFCDSQGIKYRITKGIEQPMEFLDIDFKKDINEAHRMVAHIAENIFGIPGRFSISCNAA